MATTRGARKGGARKTAAKKGAAKSRSATKGATGKRELLEPSPGDKRYVRRTADGTFAENQDDVGRSLSQDVKRRAKKTVAPGHGDEGDQKRRAPRKAAVAKKSAAKKSATKTARGRT